MADDTKRWPLPVPLAVQRYVVDRNGNEVSSSALGPVFERQRIIAPDAAVDEPMIIADMAGGGLEKAKALVLAANAYGPMREAFVYILSEHAALFGECGCGICTRASCALRAADGEN